MAAQTPLFPQSITHHVVTASNPATSTPQGMDYDRCAALHNHIYEVAWVGSGRPIDEMPRATWFSRFGDAAEEVRPRLDPSLAKFLEQAYDLDGTGVSFFYYVGGLVAPDHLWRLHMDDGDEGRWLTLYWVNSGLGSDGDGLNYDQSRHTSVMQLDVGDADWTRNNNNNNNNDEQSEALWYPLETVLSKWLEMTQIGKITVEDEEFEAESEKFEPWVYHPYSERQVEEAVSAFHRLTDAIQTRMASGLSSTPDPLVPAEALESASVDPGTFAHAFLSTAKRPADPLKYIAPGLLLPPSSAESFKSTQAFSTIPIEDADSILVPPVLLFPLSCPSKITLDPDDYDNSAFDPSYVRATSENGFVTGLYADSVDRGASVTTAEEGFRLVLPYSIGDKGYARKSDGDRFDNKVSLFQHGFFSFGGEVWRAQRLTKLFDKWTANVEGGAWGVGETGVEGGVEKWKEADTANGWRAYWIEADW